MKAVKKMLVSMKLHLDASIDKLDNLAMNVKLDKEKHMENMKKQEQTEPERAEAERVEEEVVYLPMVAEPQEYQYNADAFEARGVDDGVQREHNKKLNNGLPILHKVPPKRDYGRYFCIMAEKGGTSTGA